MQPDSAQREERSVIPADARVGGRDDERLCRLAVEQGRLSMLPLAASLAFYAVLLASFVPPGIFEPWLFAMLLLVGLRALVLASHERVQRLGRRHWLVLNVVSMAVVGAGFGISTLWVGLPEHFWVLAIFNLWLGGLSCAALIGQGSVRWHGLAFAIPAMLPLQARLLASGEPLLLTTGLGNLLFFAWLFVLIQRNQRYTLDEIRHRVHTEAIAERLAQEQARSAKLVSRLSAEVERRRKAQAALLEAHNRTRELSNLDPLTRLANRRVLERVLEREWARARREQRPLSLVMCDIDRFRPYNELYGHHAGDLCLIKVGEVVGAHARRAGDLVARFGGEEFALLLPGASEVAAVDIAESIRGDVYDLTLLHGASDVERIVTASCGAATIVPGPDQVPQTLVEAAANALLRAKRAGRNCVYTVYGALAQDEG